jgi:endonuclease-8
MPEGDSVFRAASRVRVACAGRAVLEAETRGPGPSFGRLRGATLDEVETHGKNLFFRFSSGLVVHAHLRMTGKLRVVEGSASGGAFRARIVLGPRGGPDPEAGDPATLLFLGAPVVRLVTRSELVGIRQRLGADPLRGEISEPEVVAKVLAYDGTLGEALLVQRVMAGVGNIVKCEAFFLAKADPFLSCASCTEETAGRVVAKAVELLRASVARKGGAPRDDDSAPFAAPFRMTRGRPDPYRQPSRRETTWVYGRAGEPCRTCGTRIVARPQGRPPRTTYYCPTCQADGARATVAR